MALGQSSLAAIPAGKANALKARAASQGELRLIVQLAPVGQPVGKLTSAARQSRMQQIAALQTTLMAQARQPGLRELRRFSTIPFMLVAADAQAIDMLARLPQVISIQEDIPEEPSLASSLPVIGAADAWSAGYDGTGQVVVVLDTGVDTSHPFFPPAKLVAEACFSTTHAGNKSMSLCPGGASSSTAPGSGQDCPADVVGCDHGTHVAGIAVGNNGVGPNLGVAKGAGIIPIQVFSCFSNTTNCVGMPRALAYQSDQISALEHVLTLSQSFNIAAVNMSLGGSTAYSSQVVCDEENAARKAVIDNLLSVEIATIVAAGNNQSRTGLSQPGCISTAISVGNTTDADLISANSNVAVFMDLLAPGTDIISSVPGGGLLSITGTSMSTPHVSGAWAVLRQAKPLATVDQILETLRSTATVVNDQRTSGVVTDMRRINLDQALSLLITPQPEFSSDPVPDSDIDLGDVTVGDIGTPFDITVTNTGDADLALSCALVDAPASTFSLIQCPSPIVAAASAPISLRCDPQNAGELVATLEVSSNEDSEPVYSYSINCTGMVAEIVTSPVAGTELDLGGVPINTASTPQNIQVSNTGNLDLVLSCDLTGPHPEAFVISACPASVAAAAQLPVSIYCQTNVSGSRSATLQITSNDQDEGVLDFLLACTGLAPEMETDPVALSLLDFGTVNVGESSAPISISVSNTGNAGLNISCDFQGSHPLSFDLVQCPGEVPPSQSVEVQVQCIPKHAGTRLAELRIASNDVDEAEVLFSLSCLAQFAPDTVFSDSFEPE